MPLISFPFKNTAVVRGNVFPMTHDFRGDSVMRFTFMPVIILSGVLSRCAALKKYQRRCTLGEPQEGEKCGKASSEETSSQTVMHGCHVVTDAVRSFRRAQYELVSLPTVRTGPASWPLRNNSVTGGNALRVNLTEALTSHTSIRELMCMRVHGSSITYGLVWTHSNWADSAFKWAVISHAV